jgi:hypothetical protein
MSGPSPAPSVAAPSAGFSFYTPIAATLPVPVPYVLAAALAVVFFFSFQASSSKSRLPLLNPKKRFELLETGAKSVFLTQSRGILEAWFRSHPDKAARVIGDAGEVIVLPPRLANEIRNDPRLSFAAWVRKVGMPTGSWVIHLGIVPIRGC